MLNRPVAAEIGMYRDEPGISDVEVKLERVTLKVGTTYENPIVGTTTERDFDCVVIG